MAQSAAAFLDEAPSAAAFLDAPDVKPSAAAFLDASDTATASQDQARQVADTTQQVVNAATGPGSLAFANRLWDATMSGPEEVPIEQLNSPKVETGHEMGMLEKVRRSLSPVLGPTASQKLEESIPVTDEKGNRSYQYKPLANKLEQGGLFAAPYKIDPMQAVEGDSKLTSTGKALFNTTSGVLQSLESPGGIIGGLAASVPGLGRALSAGFAADMASHIPEQLDQLAKGKTFQERLEGGLGAAVSLLTAGVAGTHALAGEGLPVRDVLKQTTDEIRKITPPDAPVDEKFYIDPTTLDHLHITRDALLKDFNRQPTELQQARQQMIDVIDEQLLHGNKADVQASAERVATRLGTATPPEGTPAPTRSAEPTTPAAGPHAEGGTSKLFRQAQEESGVSPEPVAPITDTAMHQSAEESAQRIADQVTQGQGDVVRDAAYNAAIDNARSSMKNGIPPNSKFMRKSAMEAAGKTASKQGVSMDAESESGHSIANTIVAPEPKTENTEPINAMHQAIDAALSERDAKILRGQMDGKTLEEIGKEHGISKQRAGKIIEESLPKIRAEMEKAGFTKDDVAHVEAEDWTQATAEPKGMLRKDFGEGGAAGGAGASSRGLKIFKDRKMSELDQATGNRSAKLQRSFDDASRIQKEVDKIAPHRDTQGGISLWIEAGGDDAKLKAWESGAKETVLKKAAKAAQSLTPEQITLARKIKATFDILEQRGNKYDVLGQHRDNYVPHVWDLGSKPIFGGGLKQNFKFNKARTFENFAEGDAAGFKPKTLEIGKLLPSYLEEMNRVIADRQFVEEMNGKDIAGRPAYVPRGRVSEITTESGGKAYLANPDAIKGMKDKEGNPIDTSDYKVLDQPALHDWRWEGKDENGNPIFMRDDLALHPDMVKRITAMVGKSKLTEWANAPREGIGESILPAAFRGLDKSQSVMKREMFSVLAPFHQVQEGTHAIAHLVSPFTDIPKIDMRNADQMDAARHGLMLLPDRTNAQQYLEGLGGQKAFLSQAARFLGEKTEGAPLVSKGAKGISDVVDGYQTYLFHQYIPGLKFKTYTAILERNMNRFGPEISRGELTPSDVKLLSAEQTNAAYGHLNYAMLDRSPTMQHFLRLGLLAPDFLEARGRFVAQSVKGLLGSKVGFEQLKALATIAAIQAAAAYTITTLTGNKWDPKDPFTVVNGNRKYGMRTVPADLVHMIRDFRQFSYSRVNPLSVKGTIQLVTGQNYRGEKVGALDTLEELLAQYIPITARQVPGIRQLTETGRQSPITPLEQLAGSLGMKVSRKSPINDTYNLAGDWMKEQKIEKKTGSYPISKYQQLRYALEDGDAVRAKAEYDKLKTTEKPAKISRGFRESVTHSFTQNQAMDRQFSKSLKPEDKAVYDLAVQKRKNIINLFSHLH